MFMEDQDDLINDEDNIYVSRLESVFDSMPSSNVKVSPGGFNARIGKEFFHCETAVGPSLHHITNENASRLTEFAGRLQTVDKNVCLSDVIVEDKGRTYGI